MSLNLFKKQKPQANAQQTPTREAFLVALLNNAGINFEQAYAANDTDGLKNALADAHGQLTTAEAAKAKAETELATANKALSTISTDLNALGVKISAEDLGDKAKLKAAIDSKASAEAVRILASNGVDTESLELGLTENGETKPKAEELTGLSRVAACFDAQYNRD